jgi:hypothetical protein
MRNWQSWTSKHKEAQDDDDDDTVISEEKTLTMKGLKEAFSKIYEAVDYFQTMILFLIVLPRLNTSYNVLSCYKAILQAKM